MTERSQPNSDLMMRLRNYIPGENDDLVPEMIAKAADAIGRLSTELVLAQPLYSRRQIEEENERLRAQLEGYKEMFEHVAECANNAFSHPSSSDSEFMHRIVETIDSYGFACEAGPLEKCGEWNALKREIFDLPNTLVRVAPQAAPRRELTSIEGRLIQQALIDSGVPVDTPPQEEGETEQHLREQNLRGLLREAREYVEVADTDHSASLLRDINEVITISRLDAQQEMVPRRLLNERDDFIVSKGLWSEFTDSLSRPDAPQEVVPTDEDHPDCITARERELYDALMLLSSACMNRAYKSYKTWMQGGIKVHPVVTKALRLT